MNSKKYREFLAKNPIISTILFGFIVGSIICLILLNQNIYSTYQGEKYNPDYEWSNKNFEYSNYSLYLNIDIISDNEKSYQTFIADILVDIPNKNSQRKTTCNIESPNLIFGYYLNDFEYPGLVKYGYWGSFEFRPIDSYILIFEFEDLDSLDINSTNQIYLSMEIDSNWKIKNTTVKNLINESDNSIKFEFILDRTLVSCINEIAIPITIISGLIITAFTTYYESDASEEKESIINNKEKLKFRVDTAKWIFAFGVANVLFNDNNYFELSFGIILSYITLILCTIYYFSSKGVNKSKEMLINLFTVGISFALLYLLGLMIFCYVFNDLVNIVSIIFFIIILILVCILIYIYDA